MIRTAASILSALLLAAPATQATQTSVALPLDGATLQIVGFQCGKGTAFDVQYLNAGPNMLAILPIDGQQRIFVNVISGSGARYVSGQYEWWTKGGTATLSDAMWDGSRQECVATR
ncbi:Membrane-bound lysozyme inhibitor of C-type lysozyme precursor [Paracoccus haematequi]|uniref:Membrane-bound lysozyme inhibitor of C-type lysozyme n=1 Tax=Paracoccus haematequi TaxID=2491866 RepID=A0A447IT32_9RHOB|nr:MliC family protein [Paracoccus haematequi]VDS10640.1 Membrane-bound lysozyme inhibitor of C-type lysozyme precursor [Paracoccus haematequi]